MALKIILLFTVLAYSIIVSQSFMYILSLKQVHLGLNAASFTELRKLVDAGMSSNFKYVIYAALLANLALVAVTIKNPGSLLFITASIAFIALVIDTVLALKGNVPINAIISGWATDNYPVNWADYRAKWLHIFQYRQFANITGFVSLLIGTIFGSR